MHWKHVLPLCIRIGVEKVDRICHRLAQLSGALTEHPQQFQDAPSLAICTYGSPPTESHSGQAEVP